jgi:hypothetical protein
MSAHVSYDRTLVIASVVIAVVAATAALWFTLRVRSPVWITGAAMVMGLAVAGMHYTGMFALIVTPTTQPEAVGGADALDFLVPLMTVISLITLTMLLMVILSPSERELNEDAELVARLERRRRATQEEQFVSPPPAPVPAPAPAPAPRPVPILPAPTPHGPAPTPTRYPGYPAPSDQQIPMRSRRP